MENSKSSFGFKQNIVAFLSYLFGFISGLIIFLLEKENKFVKFHALQSTITFLLITVVNIILGGLSAIPFIGFLFKILLSIVGLISLVLWIVGLIFSIKNEIFKFPIIGDVVYVFLNKD